MKKLSQVFAGAVSLAMAAVMGVVTYYSTALPDHFYVAAGAAAEGISRERSSPFPRKTELPP